MLAFAAAVAIWHALVLMVLVYAHQRTRMLGPADPQRPGPWPRVSVLIAARNEATEIEPALQSVLALDYPDYEVIVVNDRSNDQTGDILTRLAERDRRLRVLAIADLPSGWLGKNHALYRGAMQASGELLLFTDADVIFANDLLRRGVAVLLDEEIDHLTVSPSARSASLSVNLMIAVFVRSFMLYVRPWLADNPGSKAYVGIGAFNLVRRHVYEMIGGHESIRLRPDDDHKLGKIIKQAGFRQSLRVALSGLSLKWYRSFGELVRGFEKNVLAGVDYRVTVVVASVVAMLAHDVVPIALVLVGEPAVGLLGLVAYSLSASSMALHFRQTRIAWRYAPLLPLAALLLPYIFARSAWLTIYRGGIVWRDTFYPLAELKRNSV